MMRISPFSHFDKRETFSQINVKAYVSVIILEVAMDGSFLFFIGHISDAQKGKNRGKIVESNLLLKRH